MAALPDKSARPVMCPVKAGMFSREQTCRGRSQNPVVWIAEETSAGVRDTKRLMISREVSQASIVENLSPAPAVPHRSAEIKFAIDSSLEGDGFEPMVPRHGEAALCSPGERSHLAEDAPTGGS